MTLRRTCVLTLVLCTLSAATVVAAQSPDRASGPPAPASNLPDDERLGPAREHIAQGESMFDAGNYRGALAEFERAYELLRGHPAQGQVLYNLALCHERLFAYTQAVAHYERYLREAGAQAEDRQAVESALQTLRGLLATLVLRIRFEKNRPGVEPEVWLDQQKLAGAPTTLLVPSGRHRIEVRAPGYQAALREVQLASREHKAVELELEALSRGLSPALFWSSVAATGALAVTGGVLGARALSLRTELADRPTLARTEADERELHRRMLASDVVLGATGLFALTTTLLYFLTDFDPPRREAPKARAKLALIPFADAGVALRGILR